jgi:hypothetical protein
MINGGETADKMVDYTLKIGETVLRLSGTAAKNLAAYLLALSKDNKKTRGKTRLVRMLKEGKELKVFQIDIASLKRFMLEAKQYGILYTALHDKKNKDGTVDLLVKAEDASKVNRVLERIQLSVVDAGNVEATIERDRKKSNPTKGRTKERPSETVSLGKETPEKNEKPSVREALKRIKSKLERQKQNPVMQPQQSTRASKPMRKGR